jgi:hypothetical protein
MSTLELSRRKFVLRDASAGRVLRFRRGIIHLRCPSCAEPVELVWRKRREQVWGPVPGSPAAESSPVSSSANVTPQRPPIVSPLPTAPAPERRRRVTEETEPAERDWLVPVAALLISAALISANISVIAALVLPFGAVGLLLAWVALIKAYRSERPMRWPVAAQAFGAGVLLLALFFPGCLGSTYYAYRQPTPDFDAIEVVPKQGQAVVDLPRSPEWADASRFALVRNGTRVEITHVTLGPIEVREPSGTRKLISQPHLVVWLRRQRAGDPAEFAHDIRERRDRRDAPIDWQLSDNTGQGYPRRELELATDNQGIAHTPGNFPVSTTDDAAVFAAPIGDFEALRLQVSSPQLGSGPLRFTIPKSMIERKGKP